MFDRRAFFKGGISAALLAQLPLAYARSTRPIPPRPPKHPVTLTAFGHERQDEYAWLKPDNWATVRRDPCSLCPPIREVLIAENSYADAILAPTRNLQKELLTAFSRYQSTMVAAPQITEDGWCYGERFPTGADQPIFVRSRKGTKEELLLDANAEAQGKAFYALSFFQRPLHSPNHRFFAWAADTVGSEYYTLFVRDITSAKLIVSNIHTCFGSFLFSPDSRYLFWVHRSEQSRPTKVFRRDLESGMQDLVYEETDPALFLDLTLSASGKLIRIRSFNGEMSETRLIFADAPAATPQLAEPRTRGIFYEVQDWQNDFLILTNVDGAEDYKIMRAQRSNLSRTGWHDWIAHKPGRLISEIHPFRYALVRLEWAEANPQLTITEPDGRERRLTFTDPAYQLRLLPGQPYENDSLHFIIEAPNRPPCLSRYKFSSGVRTEMPAAAAFDTSRFVVRRLFATAPDGEKIPLSVLARKDLSTDGSAPLYLYGYGSYGDNLTAGFSPEALALVERGWVYALAHVRGGAEKGTHWWRTVMGQGKKTTFTDFIACAEHLITAGYTKKGRIIAHGFSAGGLMTGAVYNMRPDLWAGVIMQVPFVDLLGTMSDSSHPLWYTALPFWGDPRIAADWNYMASYAPYDNIPHTALPPLFATGSLSDGRVAFWEPVKFAIRARDRGTTTTPKIVKIDMAAGHLGAGGTSGRTHQQAAFFAFAIQATENQFG